MSNTIRRLFGTRFPLVVAPMAGGVTTPELVIASSEAGALGSLGAAYLTAGEIDETIAKVRARTTAPFAVNLFAPQPSTAREGNPALVQAKLNTFRTELGLPHSPEPAPPTEPFDRQFEAVLRVRPRVFSFTFGRLPPECLAALRKEGIVTAGTATTLEEAETLEADGIDIICAQGSEAGGHRGTFIGSFEDGLIGTLALVPAIVRRVRVPVLAAGGLMDGRAIAAAHALGAQGVQLGTAFMCCPEAGTSAPYRAALRTSQARHTMITAAFSGRPARGLRNRFAEAFDEIEPLPFPEQQQHTRDIRAVATRSGCVDLMQLWAGQGAPLIRELPAGELIRTIAEETRQALGATPSDWH